MSTHTQQTRGVILSLLLAVSMIAISFPMVEAGSTTDQPARSIQADTASSTSTRAVVSGCQVINQSGNYELTTDIINSTAEPCIEITANNVTLDGNGHTIDGVDNDSVGVSAHGVNRTFRITNVTVRNLTVTNWRPAILFRYVTNGRITNVAVTRNGGLGIGLEGNTDDVTVANTTISRNHGTSMGPFTGISTGSESNDIVLRDNNVSNNEGGPDIGDNHGTAIILRGNSSRVVDNRVSENDGIGIWLQGAHHGLVRNNTVMNNGDMSDGDDLAEVGIRLHGATNNVVADNLVAGNDGAGISLRVGFSSFIPARDNVVRNNTVRNNRHAGISLTGAINATLQGNTISGHNPNLRIDGPYTRHFNHTITTTNTVAGKPVYYLVNESDVVVGEATDAGFVGVVNSHNVSVRELTLDENTRYGALFVNTTHSTVSNVSVTGNARGGLLFQNTSRIVLSDSNVSNNDGDGVVLRGASDMRIRNTIISNNSDPPGFPSKENHGVVWEGAYEIEQALDFEIRAEFGTGRNNTLRNNTISEHSHNGIYVWDGEGTTLIDNNVSNNGNGITIVRSNRTRVIDNTVRNRGLGVDVRGHNNTIANNRISTTLGEAVSLDGSDISVKNNTIEGGTDIDGSGHVVRNNTISNGVEGMEIFAENVRVIENNITDSDEGIRLWFSDNITLINNTLSGNREGIFVRPSADNNTLIDNIVSNNGEGIRLSSSGNRLAGNNVSNNDGNGIYVTEFGNEVPRNNLLINNTVSNNTDPHPGFLAVGILLDKSVNTTLKSNVLARNTKNLGVSGTRLVHFRHTITRTNLVEGRPVFYLVNESNVRIEADDDPGYVGVVNGSNVTVQNVDPPANYQGILFVNVADSRVRNVTAINNTRGIRLIESAAVTVRKSTVSSNQDGIGLSGTTNVTLIDNTVSQNFEGIINLDLFFGSSHNATLIDNNVSYNEEDGIELSSGHTLIDNIASNNQRGFRLGNNNTLSNNTASENANFGYRLGSHNVLVNSTPRENGGAGMSIDADNTIINATVRNNGGYGITTTGDDNVLRDLNALGNDQGGIELSQFGTSKNNTLIDSIASNNTGDGITVSGNGHTLINNTALNNSRTGIRVSGTKHTLRNNSAFGNEWAYVGERARNNRIRRLRIGSPSDPTIISFTMETGTGFDPPAVRIRDEESPPADPSGHRNIGIHIEATADREVAWINLTVHYTDSDVAGVNESTLKMWRHNGTAWSPIVNSTVNTTQNGVLANVTEFSVIAPLGETNDTTAPSITNATAIDQTDGDGIVRDGDTVTVSAAVTDMGTDVKSVWANASAFGVGNVTLIDDDNDGVYNATFAVTEANAAPDGSYAISILANDTAGNLAIAETGLLQLNTSAVSIPEAIDSNDDGVIGNFEILNAIELWRDQEPVPGTDGKTIGNFEILDLIEKWRDQDPIDETSVESIRG